MTNREHHMDERRLEMELAEALRRAPMDDPGPDFAGRVMAALEPRRPGAWTRLALWLTTPRSLSASPLRMAGVATACVLALALAIYGGLRIQGSGGDDAPGQVVFVLPDPGGSLARVAVIGSFNDWDPDGYEMRYDASSGVWTVRADLPEGSHEYVFLVNGEQTVTDPSSRFVRDDGFGSRNSVLMIGGDGAQRL